MKSKKIFLEPVISKVESTLPCNEMYKYVLTEIDFVTFGAPPDLKFLKEVEENLAAFSLSKINGNHEKHLTASIHLLAVYKFVWNIKEMGLIRQFFQSGGMQSGLRETLKLQKEIYNSSHKLCITARKILQEHSVYLHHWDATRKHIKTQKQILKSKYKFYKFEINKRDRYFCSNCGISENLELDHIKPVSRGGLTEIINLQFLCKSCNISKSNRM